MPLFQRIFHNKYNYLLICEMFFITIFPFAHLIERRFPFTAFLIVMALVPPLFIVMKKRWFIFALSLSSLALLIQVLISYQIIKAVRDAVTLLFILYALFILIAIVSMSRKISSLDVVTSDTIKGGISVYFLIGLLWAIFYMFIHNFDNDAYAKMALVEGEDLYLNCIYYSFTTLTTLGYGDITPTTPVAKTVAIMESFTGQLYIAIFVAQLVGLNIAQKLERSRL